MPCWLPRRLEGADPANPDEFNRGADGGKKTDCSSWVGLSASSLIGEGRLYSWCESVILDLVTKDVGVGHGVYEKLANDSMII